MKAQLLVPAAGSGVRLGCEGPKALADLDGRPMLARTLARFESLGLVDKAVVVAPAHARAAFEACIAAYFPGRGIQLANGGAERQESVHRGLDALDAASDIVVIHDAARPFVEADSVRRAIAAAAEHGAATVAVRTVDTILEEDGAGFLAATPDRARLWACQTPQVFRMRVICEAHHHAQQHGAAATDDATLVKRCGGVVRLIEGNARNFKVTTPEDLARARRLVREEHV